jgi:CRP/FNR family transcriptional regulator, cyclic AMP receptor protein
MAALGEPERSALLGRGADVGFRHRDVVVLQGDVGDSLYVLTGGVVKVTVAAESGAETIVAFRSRGDLIGEFALMDDKPRVATARAVGAVGAIKISRQDFEAFGRRHPAALDTLMRSLLAKMRASTDWNAQRARSARERLARALYGLAIDYGETEENGSVTISLELTQSEMGELAGTAVSTTERILAGLREEGVVATGYKEITVRDVARLREIAASK